jgi:hypothetical protein
MALPNAKFMAAVYRYPDVAGATLIEHLNACYKQCYSRDYTGLSVNNFDLIKNKIKTLEQTYKPA